MTRERATRVLEYSTDPDVSVVALRGENFAGEFVGPVVSNGRVIGDVPQAGVVVDRLTSETVGFSREPRRFTFVGENGGIRPEGGRLRRVPPIIIGGPGGPSDRR